MSIWTDLATVPHRLEYVDAGGVMTRSLQTGSGEPWILLHGTTGHLEAFSRVVGPMADLGEIHAIDMLGSGYTDKPDYDYTIPRYVEHLLAYMDACGMSSATIVGQSLGGWVGSWLASEHPDRVQRLVLAAPGGTNAVPETMRKIRETTLQAVNSDDIADTRARLSWLHSDPDSTVSEELVQIRFDIYQRMRERVERVLILQDMETRQANLLRADRLGRISAPTLLIWTSENPTGGLDVAEQWSSAIPDCERVVLGDCGHWPQFEQPEAFVNTVREFVKKRG